MKSGIIRKACINLFILSNISFNELKKIDKINRTFIPNNISSLSKLNKIYSN